MERQLTSDPVPKDLDNNLNFSTDGKWLVFDCRKDATGIPTNTKLGMVNVDTGELRYFYTQCPPAKGVGAASFLNKDEVVAIHALTSGLPYDFTVRGGMIIRTDGSREPRWLDSRDVVSPYTPGALRGGTHKHEPDSTGEWIGFTYNDHIMKTRNGSDLRNVGVSRRGKRVTVHADASGQNFEGESFSVLLTAAVDRPRPGTDEYQKADGDCWVGAEGYLLPGGKRQRARAFRGLVAVEEQGHTAYYSEVFLVDVPDDITIPGPLGPLQGIDLDYPKPPKGATVRRLTRTVEAADPRIRGISGYLRASGDGRWIVYAGKVIDDGRTVDQLFVVSPESGRIRRLSHLPIGVIGDPRFSPDSRYVAAACPDGSVWVVSAEEATWGVAKQVSTANKQLASRLVISPDGTLLAYDRTVKGLMQIFTAGVHAFTESPR